MVSIGRALHSPSTRSPPGLHVWSSTCRHPPRNSQYDEETDMSRTSQRSATGHAVVLGAGMAGLFAARVLSEKYARVTLIDRDPLPAGPGVRRGVPQARHVHGFQARGVQVVEELFPGLVAELVQAGASKISDLSEAALQGRRPPAQPAAAADRAGPAGEPALPGVPHPKPGRGAAERPVPRLPRGGRTHARARLRPGDGVVVTGVRVVPPGGGAEDEVPADLVVDASGRGEPDAGLAGGAGLRAARRGADRGPGALREPDAPPGRPDRRPAVRDRGPRPGPRPRRRAVRVRARDLDLHGDGRREGLPGPAEPRVDALGGRGAAAGLGDGRRPRRRAAGRRGDPRPPGQRPPTLRPARPGCRRGWS